MSEKKAVGRRLSAVGKEKQQPQITFGWEAGKAAPESVTVNWKSAAKHFVRVGMKSSTVDAAEITMVTRFINIHQVDEMSHKPVINCTDGYRVRSLVLLKSGIVVAASRPPDEIQRDLMGLK